MQVNAYMFGSVPLRTYLPDGDIDLSVFCSQSVAQSMRDTWALKLQSVIEQEQRSNSNAPYKIGDVTVINAEVGRERTAEHVLGRPVAVWLSSAILHLQGGSKDSLLLFIHVCLWRTLLTLHPTLTLCR